MICSSEIIWVLFDPDSITCGVNVNLRIYAYLMYIGIKMIEMT